jgi:hypothetical protein
MAHCFEEAQKVISEISRTNLDDWVRDSRLTHELEEVFFFIFLCLNTVHLKLTAPVGERSHPRRIDQLDVLPQAGS